MNNKIEGNIVSYCDIPEEISDSHWISEYPPDCYVFYNVDWKKTIVNDFLGEWIKEKYPKLKDKKIFIHIDY